MNIELLPLKHSLMLGRAHHFCLEGGVVKHDKNLSLITFLCGVGKNYTPLTGN